MGPGEAVFGLESCLLRPASAGSLPTSFLPSSLRLSLLPGDSSSLQSSTLMEWAAQGGGKKGECEEESGARVK